MLIVRQEALELYRGVTSGVWHPVELLHLLRQLGELYTVVDYCDHVMSEVGYLAPVLEVLRLEFQDRLSVHGPILDHLLDAENQSLRRQVGADGFRHLKILIDHLKYDDRRRGVIVQLLGAALGQDAAPPVELLRLQRLSHPVFIVLAHVPQVLLLKVVYHLGAE